MALSFFNLLGPVMEREINFVAEHLNISRNEVYDLIVAEAEKNHAEWYSGKIPNLNYKSPACRLAYLYIVAAANASTVYNVLNTNDGLKDYILEVAKTHHSVKICAFGGGPGTELMALATFFEQMGLGNSVSVDFQLLDKVEEWSSSWFALRDQINSTFRDTLGPNRAAWPFIPSGNFLPCDITDTERIGSLGHIWHQDVYIINFLLSEIFTTDPGMLEFLSQVTRHAPQGARFIMIERRGTRWEERMAAIADRANLDLSPFIESEGRVEDSPSNLGIIYKDLKARRSPRVNWKVVYTIGVKR